MEEQTAIVYNLNQCNYFKDKKRLLLNSSITKGFPPSLWISSDHTRRLVEFKAVQPGDPLWDQDGWDGEQCIYRPSWHLPNVECLVIFNC